MLTLNDGRKELYQWDTGRTATVAIECDVVHFANLKCGESLAVEVKAGEVSIPNKLLTSGAPIYCWAFAKDDSGSYTKKEQTLAVTKRAKPSDYVYTETEVITIKTAVENALQEAKESGDFKGEKGDKGDTGENGTSVTVSAVSESTADGGQNIVTFSDGKTLTVKNGSKGSQGEKGEPTDVQQKTGQSITAVMSQKAVTDNLAKKVEMVSSTSPVVRLYGVRHNSTKTMMLEVQTSMAKKDSIPRRNANGTFAVGTPTNPTDAVNKGYVDNIMSLSHPKYIGDVLISPYGSYSISGNAVTIICNRMDSTADTISVYVGGKLIILDSYPDYKYCSVYTIGNNTFVSKGIAKLIQDPNSYELLVPDDTFQINTYTAEHLEVYVENNNSDSTGGIAVFKC